jgi:hypothetical protein
MKTKLFSFFIAVFLFSIGSKAQTTTTCPASNTWPHCISLIGPGTPGGDWATDTFLSSTDGNVYTKLDVQFSAGEIKFRQDGCWDGCTGNPPGWGPLLSTQTGWPSGANTAPVAFGPNIQCPGGVWNVKFTLSTQSWEFTAGTPNAVVKLVGTGVTGSPITMTTKDGENYEIKLAKLTNAQCQFEVDGTLGGSTAFPNGSALNATETIPVLTTGIDYDVTFKLSTYAYTFAVATFPKIAIIGAGAGGWPNNAGEIPGPIDINPMTTTDGVIYTISNFPLTTGEIKFRQDDSWNNNWGGSTWPSGPATGSNIPAVAGNYNGTFNKTTGAYAFTLRTPAVVGSGVGGWPNNAGEIPGPIDINPMTTVDGINYSKDGLVVTAGEAKFRINNDWGVNTGGDLWPAGPKTGNNIPTQAGTYNLKYNILTGAYDFGANLSVNKFDQASFKAYPNPTRGSWNIVSGNEDITSIQVFDVLGKVVYTKFGAEKEVTVNGSELSRGVYYAKVATANGESTLKLVKE